MYAPYSSVMIERLFLSVLIGLTVQVLPKAQPSAPRLDTALSKQVEAVLEANEGVVASLWLGGADGEAWFELDADQIRPTASAIKAFYLVELFDAHRGKLDRPLPGAELILKDDAHPAISHFMAGQRDEIRRGLSGASVRRIGELMIGKVMASNAVYNAAANLTTAALGGPEALTALIRKRDLAFARVSARRYMLRDRFQPGDNEAPASAFAALYQKLASRRLRGVDAKTMDAIHETLRNRDSASLGKHFNKAGVLDSDPITHVRAGWWETAKGPLVYVVMTMQPSPGAAGREASERQLSETCEALRDILASAGWASMNGKY